MTLISKIDLPLIIKNFRPNSLCNVTFKLITKIIVNQLRPFLDELVGPLESSFILGRGTSDNAILVQ